MKIVLLCLLVSVGYLLVGQIKSGEGLSQGWFLAYLLYSGPFSLMLLSCLLVKPRFANTYGVISLLFLMLAAYLVSTDQELYVLPALASVFLPVSGATLVISLVVRVYFYVSSRRKIT